LVKLIPGLSALTLKLEKTFSSITSLINVPNFLTSWSRRDALFSSNARSSKKLTFFRLISFSIESFKYLMEYYICWNNFHMSCVVPGKLGFLIFLHILLIFSSIRFRVTTFYRGRSRAYHINTIKCQIRCTKFTLSVCIFSNMNY